MISYTLDFSPVIEFTDEQFYQLCRANPDVKFERTAKGEIVIVSPTGGETGRQNAQLIADFVIWNRQMKLGEVFDSSTCFRLPNGAMRSPDVAWIQQARWDALTPEQKTKFPPIAPDFVLELVSPSARLQEAQVKLQEYINHGVRLGWLIAPILKRVEIYQPNLAVEVLESPSFLRAEEVLPGLSLNLEMLWR
jgi:Uma2 family endonuclease